MSRPWHMNEKCVECGATTSLWVRGWDNKFRCADHAARGPGPNHERDAFEHVATYHYRAESDRCACGPLPLGSSFPRHLWDEFEKLRTR